MPNKRGQPAKPWRSVTLRVPIPCLDTVKAIIAHYKASTRPPVPEQPTDAPLRAPESESPPIHYHKL